jgi:PAS domain S-box-containing protein
MKPEKRLLFIPLILIAFSYLFYSVYKDVKNRTINELNNHQFSLAKQASRGIESFFIYYQRELLFLSKLNFIVDLNDQGRELLADFYNSHSDQIEAITIVDDKGILKYTFPINESAIGRDISPQEHVKEILSTHSPTLSDVFTTIQGYSAIAYHIPIFKEKIYTGSLAIAIPLDKLGQRFIENIRTGKSGYGWVISEDGIELYSPAPDQKGKSVRELYRDYPSVVELLEKTSKEKEGTSICDMSQFPGGKQDFSKVITAFYRVPLVNTFWTIIIFTPENEVFATLKSFRNRMYILFSLIILVISTYFYLAFKASTVLSEQKKSNAIEKVLRESEKRFRIMFELSPVGIILIDEKGTIIEVNPAFCEMLGYSRKELISKNIRVFTKPDKEGIMESNIARILSGDTLKHEVTNLRKDGTTCEIALYETKIMLPHGKPGILSVANDITERKRSQTERQRVHQELIASKEKAEESDRLKSAFLTNMSHELRTPLNAIIGFSTLMIDSGSGDEITSNLKIILNSGHHLLGLVEEILDISLIETGQIKIKYEKVGINLLLYEVKNIILGEKLELNKTDIELIVKIDPEPDEVNVLSDSRKLKQVLINLLKNSLKFTEKGTIEFGYTEIRKEGKRFLKFFVKDSGIGIEKKNHEVIFTIFRQVDDTHTRKYGGTGIGLFIAKRIVEMLGGTIWVESEPGKGAEFSFTIPLIPAESQAEGNIIPPVKSRDYFFDGKTILIAEDDQTSFEFLKLLLNRMNIEVIWAKTGTEAIKLIETGLSVDLILMDIKMPEVNGYEVTRIIKKKRPDLPVIAQTAYATIDEKEEALKAGCDDYLSKPIQVKLLTELLIKYL